MSTNSTAELRKKIEELEQQLKQQQEIEAQTEEIDCGLWEYIIADKRLVQSKKLGGQFSETSLIVENYREQVRKWNLIYPDDWDIFDAYVDSMDRGDAHYTYELRAMCDDGYFVWYRYEGQAIYNEDGIPVKSAGRTLDITEEKNERDRLEKQVSRDLLTGLYNREVALRMIERKLPADTRTGGALLIVDIDDFKQINDKFGRLYGDTLLETISGIIYTHFRAKDIVSRVDGDEFLIYCSGVGDETGIRRLVDKLMVRFQEFVVDREGNRVGLSVGIALYPVDGDTYADLYHSAFVALACAKQSGKNRYVIYEPAMAGNEEIINSFEKAQEKHHRLSMVKQAEDINKELFDFSFDVISHEKNFYDALQIIFKEVCLYFSLDRSTLMERAKGSQKISVTAKWAREDDGNDAQLMEQTSVGNWSAMEADYKETEFSILEEGKSETNDFRKDIVIMNKIPVTAVQFPVMDGDKMTGALTFERWEKKEWTQVEISTLASITKMISSYLLGIQTKTEFEAEYIVGKKAMDVQKLIYYVVDKDSYELSYMSRFARGMLPESQYGEKCYQALKGRKSPCMECPIHDCKAENDYTNTVEVYNGEEDTWYTVTASRMSDSLEDKKYLLCQSDVTAFLDRVRGEDHLTGVMSYERFRMDAIKVIRRSQDGYMLVFVGIQDFARINDEYGYEVGDQVLKAYADLMRRNMVDNELLCRVKGDDFAVLLKERPTSNIKDRLQEYSMVLTEKFRERFPEISINCFGGVYFIYDSLEHISRCLDKAMMARKVVLKNFYETGGIYTYSKDFELQEKQKEEMNRAMKESLEKGYFRVFFQPKVDTVTEEIIGAEALVRLLDKDNRLVPPGKFIPLAEENGLIVEIDKFVYDKTFELMSKWIKEGKQVPLVSVNLSRRHLLDDDLPEMIKSMSDKYGLKPEQIELEITESIFFEDTERLVKIIKRIKDLGFIISMDDFGAGFSTLSLMKTLPVDIIKLDGSFFMRNELDAKNKAVISAVMQLSKNLQFETVSEGIETKEQLDFVREQGGRCVQGYYFYKPMPAEEFEKLLKTAE